MLTIRLLGAPAIERDGAVIQSPRGRKAWALLAYLMLADRPPSRQRLAELLFADAADPLGALRWTLAELRRTLGRRDAFGGDPLSADLGPDVDVDLRRLLAESADAASLLHVTGELLEGVNLAASPEFESAALDEVRRVLEPGGRLGLTVWGHIKASPGAWAPAPFRLADAAKVANQAAMVSLGRPGVGEDLLTRFGFVDVRRIAGPFVWEFADPAAYARALGSTGPAYEAIQSVGGSTFLAAAVREADGVVRDGLPLRAEIKVIGYLARRPT